jgi:hypothetical protein
MLVVVAVFVELVAVLFWGGEHAVIAIRNAEPKTNGRGGGADAMLAVGVDFMVGRVA